MIQWTYSLHHRLLGIQNCTIVAYTVSLFQALLKQLAFYILNTRGHLFSTSTIQRTSCIFSSRCSLIWQVGDCDVLHPSFPPYWMREHLLFTEKINVLFCLLLKWFAFGILNTGDHSIGISPIQRTSAIQRPFIFGKNNTFFHSMKWDGGEGDIMISTASNQRMPYWKKYRMFSEWWKWWQWPPVYSIQITSQLSRTWKRPALNVCSTENFCISNGPLDVS